MNQKQRIVILLALALVLGVGYLFGALANSRPQLHSLQGGPSPTQGWIDIYAYPIYSHEDAISRSLGMLPHTIVTVATAARLTNASTLALRWFGEQDDSWMPNSPLWLVGVIGSNLQMKDAILIGGGRPIISDTTSIPGTFLIWNANSGDLVTSGELHNPLLTNLAAIATATAQPESAFTMEKLLTIPDENLPIVHATAARPQPTPTP